MPRHASLTHTERKNVRLTPETRTTIQAWATREGLSFSAAIEALARFGLRRPPASTASRSAPAATPAGASLAAVTPKQD
jgi:hypothetical protein